MNILLISPYFRPAVGGVETHLSDLCKYYTSRKFTVYVRTYKALGTKNRGVSRENSTYVRIHRLWWPDFNLVFKLEKFAFLRTLYIGMGLFFDCFWFLLNHSHDIDVIQVHGFIAALWSLPLAKMFKKRYVINTHVGFKFDEKSFMTKMVSFVLNSSDKVLVLTNNAKEALVNIGIVKSKITIYHYWVDQNVFMPKKVSKKSLGWKNKFTVLFVGRLVEVKGIETIIKLAEKLSNITFVLAGSGPLSDKLNDLSENKDNLLFLGRVDNKNLPKYYNASDILLVPSKIIKQEYEEGIPRVIIEALSCGLPIITTPSGGIPDVFNNSIGEMVDDDVQKIKRKIEIFFNDKKLLKQKSRNCRKFAQTYFGIKNAKIIEESLQA